MNTAAAASEWVDLRFSVQGETLDLHYAAALAAALDRALPWFAAEAAAGVHPLGGLSRAAGGWYLSSRARLTLRLPRHYVAAARELSGTSLSVGDHELAVGAATEHNLMHASVVYAGFVTFGVEAEGGVIDEECFMARCQCELAGLGLEPRLVCGKAQQARTADGLLSGFSLMVADLDVAGTIKLQQRGLGCERKLGCGIFVPHKSMAPVGTLE